MLFFDKTMARTRSQNSRLHLIVSDYFLNVRVSQAKRGETSCESEVQFFGPPILRRARTENVPSASAKL